MRLAEPRDPVYFQVPFPLRRTSNKFWGLIIPIIVSDAVPWATYKSIKLNAKKNQFYGISGRHKSYWMKATVVIMARFMMTFDIAD